MPDRERVKYDIERCISHTPDACRDCSHYTGTVELGCMENLMSDAYILLKEQEARIEQLNRFVNGFSRDAIPVVRCKDCKYGEETINAKGERMIKCGGEFPDWLRYPDWFCNDGERK